MQKKLYPYFIKRKAIGFCIFFILSLIVYFSSLSYTKAPSLISFALICILYGIRSYSNFIYYSYLHNISNLDNVHLEQEAKGFYFLSFLSVPIILITIVLMNLLLNSPHYNAGFVQVYLLFSIFILINEFLIIAKIRKVDNQAKLKDYTKIRSQNQNPLGLMMTIAIENVIIVYTLISIALKLEPIVKIIGIVLVGSLAASMIWLFLKINKEAKQIL